jgi:2-dehydro-3-deoxyphosphogluconate aldolase / (4S)-4-hydroxy-2-oxoglutarate aldolase
VAIDLTAILKKSRIIPVAQFDEPESALKTAELLQKHGSTIIEITLRTEGAIESIRAVAQRFPGLAVGAGSVLSTEALKMACDAGAGFCVAPGFDPELVECAAGRCAFVPGVSTPTELNTALKTCAIIKIFPISLLGGPEYIRALTAPFRSRSFHLVPTGGVGPDNYLDYLKQDRVIAVGMSYMVDGALIGKGEFAALEERIKKIMTSLP